MSEKKKNFAFGKDNYRWMLIGLGVLLIGYIVMSLDSTQHGQGFLGLTLGPIILVTGFIIEFYAIFKKSKADQ